MPRQAPTTAPPPLSRASRKGYGYQPVGAVEVEQGPEQDEVASPVTVIPTTAASRTGRHHRATMAA
ncbi:hypothetical protein ACK8HX_13490 [Oryzobacter sp. R7]|uniref:hypothetical protein n=1 Tax=Oryzobacter faecalis TaxID=3388656 RepID=UPI00398CF1FD